MESIDIATVDRPVYLIPEYIVVGGYDHRPIEDGEAVVVYEEYEYFLPRILKKYGFFKSMREVRNHRPDLWRYIGENEDTVIEIENKELHLLDGLGEIQ